MGHRSSSRNITWLAVSTWLIAGFGLATQPGFAQQPPLQITSQTLPFGGLGQLYRTQLTASGGVPPYQWRVQTAAGTPQNPLPPGLTLTTDGILGGTPIASGIFQFPVEVFSSNQSSGRADLRIIVIRVETDSPLPEGQANTAYSQQIAVNAGNPNWTVIAGPLPDGLSLSPVGLLTGTPATAGTFRFTLQAEVPNLAPAPAVTAAKEFQVTIARGPLGFSTSTLPNGVVGEPYSQVVRAAGGSPPYTITAAAATLPPGISFIGSQLLTGTPSAAGSFAVRFDVRDSQDATATRTIPLAVTSENAGPVFQAAPRSLRFTAFEGGAATAFQNLAVTSAGAAPVPLAAELAGAPVSPPVWLTLVNQPGTTPAQLRLRANPGSLTPGTYQTRVRLASDGRTQVEIPVTFEVRAPAPSLDVAPRVVRVSTRTANPRAEVLLVLRNNGGGAPLDYSLRVLNASRWITRVLSAPARIAAGQPVLIRLAIDTAGMRPGAYRDELRIETAIASLRVPVSLFVEELGPALDLSVRGLRFPARQGDVPNATRQLVIRNLGGLGTVSNWTAAVVRGADLFTVEPGRGTAMTGAPGVVTIGLKPNAAEAPGGRAALLRIQDPDSRTQGSPAYVVLVADVEPAGAPGRVEFPTAGLVFIGVAAGAAPAAQTFELRTGARTLAYSATASTSDAANWLRVTPATGIVTSGAPANAAVSVVTTGLGSGVYTGLVTVGVGDQVRSAGVTLILLPAGARLAAGTDKASVAPRLAEGCTPAKVAIVQTALAESFAVPAGWPASLAARLFDDCGTALSTGSVVASFSNGDAPLVLEGDGQTGVYTGTWQPGAAAATASVRLDAVSVGLQPASLEIAGGVEANPVSPPSLVTAGLLNNLNPVVGAPLAPGTVTQVYGDNLTTTPDAPSSVPLPTVYQGVEAIIGGLSAPIYYISKNQLTVQVPSELAPNRMHSAILATASGGYSLPVELPLVPVQPGTVSFPDGGLVAQHGNFTLVTAANPAKPGEIVTVYLVGMGATTTAVASGTAAPGVPLVSVVTQARVTIDGQLAETTFQGLTPGGVGLYQINVRIPNNARTGNLDIVISQDGVEANATKLPVGAP